MALSVFESVLQLFMHKEKPSSFRFLLLDPINNGQQPVRLMSETLRLSDISTGSVLLSRPQPKGGAYQDSPPIMLSNSLFFKRSCYVSRD